MSVIVKDCVVLVTGSSSGLGKEIAYEYAKRGAIVALHGRDEQKLKEVKRSIEKINGIVDYFISDLSNDGESEKLLLAIKNKFRKHISILVNSAGIAILGNVVDIPIEQYKYIINLNLVVPITLSKLVLPEMIEKGGVILNITSGVGVIGMPTLSAYSLSKAAFSAFSESLYFETRKSKVDVVLVSPGLMETNFAGNITLFGEVGDNFSDGKFVHPSYMAKKIIQQVHVNKNFINYSRSRIVGVLKYCAPYVLRKIIEYKSKKLSK